MMEMPSREDIRVNACVGTSCAHTNTDEERNT
jgi:hypothetical protein